MNKTDYASVIAALLFMFANVAVSKEKTCVIKQNAQEIYKQGTIENVRFSPKVKAIQLKNRVLVENDSPGAGLKRNGQSSEKITGKIRAKKNFFLDNPQASKAWIVFLARRSKEAIPLYIEVNGHTLKCPPMKSKTANWGFSKFSKEKNSVSGYLTRTLGWFYVPFPADWLKKGRNEVILKVKNPSGEWKLAFADYKNFHKGTEKEIKNFPYTSFRSSDNGKSWSKKLGSKQSVEGEYTIRICLKRYRAQGTIVSPVVDLAEDSGESHFIKKRAKVLETRLKWGKKVPTATSINFYVRSGKTPFYKKDCWSKWGKYTEGEKIHPKNRYLQWKALLRTTASLHTPSIINSKICTKANIIKSSFADRVRLVDYHNEKIRKSAFPYEYEVYNNPKLKELRKKFELDYVIAGSKTEFEKMLKLMRWAHYVPQGAEYVPRPGKELSWNALDYCILERTSDGKIKMESYKKRSKPIICTVANLTLFQALLSLGITARHVNIGGHEVCEAWSNEYKKWVHLDAVWDYYFYDEMTGIPLNILDMHNINAKNPDWRSLATANATPYQKKLIKEQEKKHPEKLFAVTEWLGENPYPFDKNHYLNYRVAYFRIIPRNNFLSKRYPLPLNQGCGWMPWPWNGYLNWEDKNTPPLLHYSTYTNRPQDMYPSLNQVAYTLEYGAKKGTIKVCLDTFTPNFRNFLIKVDNGKWTKTTFSFTWTLHNGLNSLQVCTENSFRNKGIISKVVLNFVTASSK